MLIKLHREDPMAAQGISLLQLLGERDVLYGESILSKF